MYQDRLSFGQITK